MFYKCRRKRGCNFFLWEDEIAKYGGEGVGALGGQGAGGPAVEDDEGPDDQADEHEHEHAHERIDDEKVDPPVAMLLPQPRTPSPAGSSKKRPVVEEPGAAPAPAPEPKKARYNLRSRKVKDEEDKEKPKVELEDSEHVEDGAERSV